MYFWIRYDILLIITGVVCCLVAGWKNYLGFFFTVYRYYYFFKKHLFHANRGHKLLYVCNCMNKAIKNVIVLLLVVVWMVCVCV